MLSASTAVVIKTCSSRVARIKRRRATCWSSATPNTVPAAPQGAWVNGSSSRGRVRHPVHRRLRASPPVSDRCRHVVRACGFVAKSRHGLVIAFSPSRRGSQRERGPIRSCPAGSRPDLGRRARLAAAAAAVDPMPKSSSGSRGGRWRPICSGWRRWASRSKAARSITFGRAAAAFRVLLWSQMHGDEPTATAALFDIFEFLRRHRDDPTVRDILSSLTLHVVPMLNPDGAERFQRRNAQSIDINRDALRLQTPEGRTLKAVRDRFQPRSASTCTTRPGARRSAIRRGRRRSRCCRWPSTRRARAARAGR